jgi:hypothetical protein
MKKLHTTVWCPVLSFGFIRIPFHWAETNYLFSLYTAVYAHTERVRNATQLWMPAGPAGRARPFLAHLNMPHQAVPALLLEVTSCVGYRDRAFLTNHDVHDDHALSPMQCLHSTN